MIHWTKHSKLTYLELIKMNNKDDATIKLLKELIKEVKQEMLDTKKSINRE